MSELLFESPIWIGLFGLALALLALVAWTQIDDLKLRKAALISAMACFAVTLILVMVNIQVQTERERIRSTLHSVAASLEANDHAAILAAIHPNASQTVVLAKQTLDSYEFEDARVTRIKSIDVNETKPPTALAQINVVVDVNLKGTGGGRGARFVKIYFMKDGDRWLVHDFEHFDVTVGFKNTAVTNNLP